MQDLECVCKQRWSVFSIIREFIIISSRVSLAGLTKLVHFCKLRMRLLYMHSVHVYGAAMLRCHRSAERTNLATGVWEEAPERRHGRRKKEESAFAGAG